MATTPPTTKQISDTIVNQVSAAISQTVPLLPLAFTRVLAKALAGIYILLYKYIGWMSLQQFVRTAYFGDTEILGRTVNPLVEWGRLIGVGDPDPGRSAELIVDITVINQVGNLPAGTLMTSNVNQITYILRSEVTLNAATVQGTFRASSDVDGNTNTGADGNLNVGDAISFVDPLNNVQRDGVVNSVSVVGLDPETEEAYRQAVIDRFQARPQGGAGIDYVIWGTEVSGIINIYPYKGTPGYVQVYAEADTSLDPDGIPTAGQLTEVENSIIYDANGLQTRKPVNVFLQTFAITRKGYTVDITNLAADDVLTLQTNITAALTEYFLEREPFIDGVTPTPRRDFVKLSGVVSIVDSYTSAVGGSFDDVELFVTAGLVPVPVQDQLTVGQKAKADAVNYV